MRQKIPNGFIQPFRGAKEAATHRIEISTFAVSKPLGSTRLKTILRGLLYATAARERRDED